GRHPRYLEGIDRFVSLRCIRTSTSTINNQTHPYLLADHIVFSDQLLGFRTNKKSVKLSILFQLQCLHTLLQTFDMEVYKPNIAIFPKHGFKQTIPMAQRSVIYSSNLLILSNKLPVKIGIL